jgi:DNA mismatch repair protein MutH
MSYKCAKMSDSLPPNTISEAMERCQKLIGNPIYCPKVRNKGFPGLLLEELLGIKKSSRCLDFDDGELKTYPIKKLKNGNLSPKETIAIGNMTPENLIHQCFNETNCHKKIQRILFVGYLREKEHITYMKPILFELAEYSNLYDQIQIDYNEIRARFIEKNEIKCETGQYIQCRTKGKGGVKEGEKKTRAFYFKTKFVRDFLLPLL